MFLGTLGLIIFVFIQINLRDDLSLVELLTAHITYSHSEVASRHFLGLIFVFFIVIPVTSTKEVMFSV